MLRTTDLQAELFLIKLLFGRKVISGGVTKYIYLTTVLRDPDCNQLIIFGDHFLPFSEMVQLNVLTRRTSVTCNYTPL